MNKKNFKASILVVTMVVMGIMLVVGLSVALVSIQDRKASLNDVKSSQAFQNAQSGAELVTRNIKNTSFSSFDNCNNSSGLIEYSNSSNILSYIVELRDMTGNKLNCSSISIINLSTIAYLKSTGIFRDTQRSIQATVPQ